MDTGKLRAMQIGNLINDAREALTAERPKTTVELHTIAPHPDQAWATAQVGRFHGSLYRPGTACDTFPGSPVFRDAWVVVWSRRDQEPRLEVYGTENEGRSALGLVALPY